MIGEEGLERLSRSFAVVVGLGGVGSHAALALVRSGIGRIRIADFDAVTPSTLERHALALPGDVGLSKAEVSARRLRDVRPGARIEALEEFFDEEEAERILGGGPGCVIDAIDSLNPKVALLAACVGRGLAAVSAMGAAGRADPGKVRVGPLEESRGCPLAKLVRKRLRRRCAIAGVTAVYSIEKSAVPPLPPDPSEPLYDRGRVRNRLPSLATLPGIFGLAAANAAILHLSSEE